MVTASHYVPFFTVRNDQGQQRAACGQFVDRAQITPPGLAPTCVGCEAYVFGLDENQPDPEPVQTRLRRRLTRHEQLQGLADRGTDTREEYEERR